MNCPAANLAIFSTALAAAMVALAGCASSPAPEATQTNPTKAGVAYPISIPLEEVVPYKGLNHTAQQGGTDRSAPPIGTTLMEAAFTGPPQTNWIYVNETFAVSTLANRGCAPVPRSIEVLSANLMMVNLGQTQCISDQYTGPYTSELNLPSEATGRPLTVAFRFLDENIPPDNTVVDPAETLQHGVLR